jgi:hypothetical protein
MKDKHMSNRCGTKRCQRQRSLPSSLAGTTDYDSAEGPGASGFTETPNVIGFSLSVQLKLLCPAFRSGS